MIQIRTAVFVLCLAAFGAVSAAPVPLRDFARHDEFQDVKLSPNGEYLAVTTPVEDQTVLAILRIKDMKITAAARLRNQEHVTEFWWVGPERVVFTLATKEGSLAAPVTYGELLGMNADGSRQAYLFGYRGAQGTGSNLNRSTIEYASASMIDPLPDDPDNALIAVNSWASKGDGITRAYRINVYTGAKRNVVGAPENGRSEFLADAGGEIRYALVRNLRNQLLSFWRPQGSSAWQAENTGDLADAVVVPVHFARDGSAAYLHSSETGDKLCLVRREMSQGGRRSTLACDEQGDIAGSVYSFDGREAIAALFETGKPRLAFLDTQNPDREMFTKLSRSFGTDFVIPVSTSRDGSMIVLNVFSDRNPGDFYLFDRATNKAQYLLSRRSWIDPKQMAERRPVSFSTRDGHTVHGYLTLPPGVAAKRLPLVVNPHGGPFGLRDHWPWDADAQALASRGYAVLQVNFRGSGGYGIEHEESGRQAWGTTMIDDITDSVNGAIAQEWADPARICIYGGSYGGYAALMSAVREPGLYRCAIGYVGAYDLELWKSETDVSDWSGGRNYIKDFVGDTAEKLKAQSPIHRLDRLQAPFMIVHGEEDKRVPFSQAKALRKAFEARKVSHEWLVKSGEGHGFYKEANRTELYEKMIAFLDRHIGATAPAPAAAATP